MKIRNLRWGYDGGGMALYIAKADVGFAFDYLCWSVKERS